MSQPSNLFTTVTRGVTLQGSEITQVPVPTLPGSGANIYIEIVLPNDAPANVLITATDDDTPPEDFGTIGPIPDPPTPPDTPENTDTSYPAWPYCTPGGRASFRILNSNGFVWLYSAEAQQVLVSFVRQSPT